MPRGVKGSGKSRKPTGEPGRPRRGRKATESLPEAIQPVEPASELPAEQSATTAELPAEGPVAEPPAAEESPAESHAAPETALVQDPAMQEAERQLVARYPLVIIRPGSLRGAGERPEHPGKRTLVVCCARCGRERLLATSDLFNVRYCESCTKVARKDARKAKKQGQS
jgi:hypothetical protein